MRKTLLILGLFLSLKLSAQIEGYACIYSKSLCGGKTANGKKLDCEALVAAHRTYTLGTKLEVTNLKNNKKIVVKIVDRGPYTKKYILDLTPAAAAALGFGYKEGKAKVRIEKL